MPRKSISQADLLAWMNRELHRNAEYKDCEFTSVTRLAEVDDVGCNWTNPNLRGHGMPVAVCQDAAAAVAERARQSFNIE
jgi:metal-dependent amidase/aminoacylase/carboxypeptidase family protein